MKIQGFRPTAKVFLFFVLVQYFCAAKVRMLNDHLNSNIHFSGLSSDPTNMEFSCLMKI